MRNMIFNFDKFDPTKTALIGENETISYGTLNSESYELAKTLGERKLVFCFTDNSIGALLGHIAAFNNGHTPLLLSSKLDRELADTLIKTYKPDWLWVPDALVPNYPDWSTRFSSRGYSLLSGTYREEYPLNANLALLLPTSGSTGSPKLVRHTYDNLRSNIASIVDYLDVRPERVAITSLPMNYTYGLSVIHIHLWAGASVIMTNHGVMQKEFWDLAKRHKATSLSGVPYTWEMLTRLGIMKMNLPDLVYCDQAGGKLPPKLQERLINWASDTGKTFIVMYGQTEASPRMGYLPWNMAKEKYGSMGIPAPGGRFRLIDDDGAEIAENDVVGELLYEGPNVTPGYATRGEDLINGDERKGVLRTGDMAKKDKDGFYTIVGRKARFLKIFGNRVNLDDLERLLRAAFPGADFACGGADDALAVYVVNGDEDKVYKEFLSEKTGLNPSAFHIKRLDAIPRNDSGKIKYSELQ